MKEKKFFAMRIDVALHYKIKTQALKEKKSMQEWIEKCLTDKMTEITGRDLIESLNGF